MKKYILIILLFICMIILATSCNNSENTIPEEKWEGLDESWNGQIMVDDELYFYTSYEIPAKFEEKSIIGEINSFVDNYEQPSKNKQANFDIKGSKYAKYKEHIAVLIDKKWILFMNQNDWRKGTTISDVGYLYEELGDDEALKLLRILAFKSQMDDNYEKNLNTIIDEVFKYCGIDDKLLIDETKSKIKVKVSDE